MVYDGRRPRDKGDVVLAWHFPTADMGLRYGDFRKVELGKTLSAKQRGYLIHSKPTLCNYGMHASTRIVDALRYAPSLKCLTRVEISGKIDRTDDKLCGLHRKVLWLVDDFDILLADVLIKLVKEHSQGERRSKHKGALIKALKAMRLNSAGLMPYEVYIAAREWWSYDTRPYGHSYKTLVKVIIYSIGERKVEVAIREAMDKMKEVEVEVEGF